MAMTDDLDAFLKGHREAIAFVRVAFDVFETWDDLFDKDRECTPNEINAAFYAALVTLPRNRFYAENFALLNPLVETAILDWYAANSYEAAKTLEGLRQAYVLKSTAQQLIVMSARIVGGHEWAAEVNAKLRLMGETWDEYAAEFGVK